MFIGCASSLELRDPIDPYEEQNRKVHEFNEKVIENLVEPVTGAYVKATPPFIRDRVTDFFENISDVKSGINNILQENFIKAINDYDYSNSLSMRLVSISENEYISIMEYDEIDKTGDDEVDGVNWLDTVEHMLEFYGESRTDSCSGLVLASYNQ